MLVAIAAVAHPAPPGGGKLPAGATEIYITLKAGTVLDDAQIKKIRDEINKVLQERYKGILKKQDLFKLQPSAKTSTDYKDMINLAQSVPQGIINSGIKGIQGRIQGALSEWLIREGFRVNPPKFNLRSDIQINLNQNWKDGGVEFKSGLQLKSGGFLFTGGAVFEGGEYKGCYLQFGYTY
ncbi:MAG: hypothetical protein U0791_02105 [Gemmataceae bacterium]